MRLLVDMNLTPRWVSYLTSSGYDAIHWSSVGPPDAKDRKIIEYAREHGWFVLTNDLDFPQILAHTKGSAPSVILLRGSRLTPEARGQLLTDALRICGDGLIAGAVLTIDWSDQLRVRLLPLL